MMRFTLEQIIRKLKEHNLIHPGTLFTIIGVHDWRFHPLLDTQLFIVGQKIVHRWSPVLEATLQAL